MSPNRLKLLLLLGGLLLSGLVLLGWTQQWFEIALAGGIRLAVGGDVAAGGLPALALACLVLQGALSIAGPVFRVVLGALEGLTGVAVVLSGVLALTDPVGASAAAISSATGLAGTESLAAAVVAVAAAFWPWLSTAAGALLIVVGGAVVATSPRWPGSGRKYGAIRAEAADGSAIGDWDALSNGDDPTSRGSARR